MKSFIGSFIGLVLSISVGAESLLEGRVSLSSGQPVVGVQVRLFDLTDLRRFVGTTTDGTGHFALPLQTFSTARGMALPTDFALGQNYPNPFNPSTVIPYQLPTSAHVRLEVFNLLGQRLATLVDAEQAAGIHTAQWDATDAAGRAVGAGVYIYRLSVGEQTESRRMVLVDGQAGIPATGAAPRSVRLAGEGEVEADGPVYGLTVSGAGLIPYVDPTFRVGVDEVDIVVEEHGGARMKLAAGGVLGDVDGNGLVDVFDVLYVLLYSVDPSIMLPNNGDISRGDVNGDGLVDVADGGLLLRYLSNPFDPALPPGIGQDPDGTLDGATQVDLGSSTDGSLSEGDEDLFVIEMSDSGTLTVYTTGSTDTYGFIWDSSGNVLDENDDGGEGWNFRVSASVSAGIYYIQVEGWETGDYTLHVVGPLDLVVAASVSDSTLAFEQPFTLRATVRNQGGGEPEPTVLFYYSSTDATITSDDTQISADAVSIETSNVVAKSLSLTAPAEAGTYYYGACVQGVSGEHDTTNNCSDAVRVTVSSDLVYTPSTPSTLSHIYWTSPVDGVIYRANLDGSNVEPLVSGLEVPVALALDVAGDQMYWTSPEQGTIYRAALDGSNIEPLVIGLEEPGGLALDVTGGQMYWTDGFEHIIYRANLDGSNVEPLVLDQEPVGGLALDVAGGQIYWTAFDWETFGIYRADLDGYAVTLVVPGTPETGVPTDLALDVAGGQMYWTTAVEGIFGIYRAALDGSNAEPLVVPDPETGVFGLALDVAGGQMYWTSPGQDIGQGIIYRAALDGSNIEPLISGLNAPLMIVLAP
ncbi:MAG: T9SS type A sorting domain-containing protein [Gemmatimonadota bacterium]|nr:T9SS type A sorting domain-containing protein [Gemmatimonadota bacterium]